MAFREETKMKKTNAGKPILMAAIKEEQHQKQLKETYGITEDIKVVEKKSRTAQIVRVLVNALFVIIRCFALVVLIVLAIIGVATLVYPIMRAAGEETLMEIIQQLS